MEQFTNSKEVIEHCHGMIGAHPRMITKALEDMGTDNVHERNEHADGNHYGDHKGDIPHTGIHHELGPHQIWRSAHQT